MKEYLSNNCFSLNDLLEIDSIELLVKFLEKILSVSDRKSEIFKIIIDNFESRHDDKLFLKNMD